MTAQAPTDAEIREMVKTAVEALRAMAQLIYIKKEVPAGILYAEVCGHLSLDGFNKLVAKLVDLKFVSHKGHVLKWIGPDIPVDTETVTRVEEVM